MTKEGGFDDFEGFEPCRDEGCSKVGVHPKHAPELLGACPICQGVLIKMPKKRARCSECAWRGRAAITKTKAMPVHA